MSMTRGVMRSMSLAMVTAVALAAGVAFGFAAVVAKREAGDGLDAVWRQAHGGAK